MNKQIHERVLTAELFHLTIWQILIKQLLCPKHCTGVRATVMNETALIELAAWSGIQM